MNLLKNNFLKIRNALKKRLFIIKYPRIDPITTHLTIEEKNKLINLSKKCKGSIYVEIGSYLGASSCCIAEGITKKGGIGKLYCIDTWENDSMSEGKIDTYEKFLKNTHFYQKFIYPLKGWSYEIAHGFEKKIDFLFIDGDHSYEAVKKDVQLWLPKMNSGAILVMHDIGWAEGVQRVVREDIAPKAKKEGRLPNLYWAWL